MTGLEILGRCVENNIKLLGKIYFDSKAVEILFADREFFSVQVQGARKYTVDLEREGNSIAYYCDCPYFEKRSAVCKHTWAALLELERTGHFEHWASDFPVNLTPGKQDEEDFFGGGLNDFAMNLPFLSSGKTSAPVPAKRSWRQILDEIRIPINQEKRSFFWPENREILYVLDRSRRFSNNNLGIQVEYRERKKNGSWKKSRPLNMASEYVFALPDPADQEILDRLIGARRDNWYAGASSYDSQLRFYLEKRELLKLLPDIAATGRLFIRTADNAEVRPVAWDGGEWEFFIDVIRDKSGSFYQIRGAFRRDAERLAVTHPESVFSEGILFCDSKIAPFSGTFEWISFFRQEGDFFVPGGEVDAWLEKMLNMPAAPPLQLPEELQLQDVNPSMRPCIRIATQRKTWGDHSLEGFLYFDYDGYVVNEGDLSSCIPQIAARRRIVRNFDAENRSIRKLESVGFRRQGMLYDKSVWTISKLRLPAAVSALVSESWYVEAEGKLFRNPSNLNMRISSGIDWFELQGTAEFGEAGIALPKLLAALKRHENTVRLDDGSYGMIPEEWVKKYDIIAGLGSVEESGVRFKHHQAGILDALLATRPEIRYDDLFRRIRDELQSFEGIEPADAPEHFHGSLRPYQREGLGWMHFLQKFSLGGCLADDMGLGKTIQVLALLEERRLLRAENSIPPSLVVMPLSLVFNWRQEAERFTPLLRVLEHTGGERIRGHEHFDNYDVIFTTYGTLRRDAVFFKEKTFDYLILDESQAVKNSSTESSKAARLLSGRHRLALSGTPIENHLGELWSLFEFLNPGMLGAASVFKPGKGAAGNNMDEDMRKFLAQALRPFILRRTKKQVARDLPDKVEKTLFCTLEPPQRALYNELRDHYRQALFNRIKHDGLEKSKIHILEALLRLRQAAIHPGLIDLKRANEPSAKMDMLLPQLREVLDEGHKALVFSQFTSMLSLLRKRLDEENIRYEYLDGQTKDRAAPVERFQNDPESKIFLISLKAGGLGLNLTAAEYVFLLDPWWNPAVEAQAVDRTHRIGQTNSVFAYRLIAKDTVEEKVLELQASKRDIADAIINQDNSLLRNLRAEDLELLLD